MRDGMDLELLLRQTLATLARRRLALLEVASMKAPHTSSLCLRAFHYLEVACCISGVEIFDDDDGRAGLHDERSGGDETWGRNSVSRHKRCVNTLMIMLSVQIRFAKAVNDAPSYCMDCSTCQ